MNLYFFVLGKLAFDFFMIREKCINISVICEPSTFVGISFHFLGDLEIKAHKLHQTGCKKHEDKGRSD